MNATIEAPPATAAPPANGKRRRILLLIAAVFIVIGILWAIFWVLVLSKRERTDDAYVNGNKVVISAQVPGTVVAVLTDDTQLVQAGQVLVRLDPIDAEISLAREQQRAGAGRASGSAAAVDRRPIRLIDRYAQDRTRACAGRPGQARTPARRQRHCSGRSAACARVGRTRSSCPGASAAPSERIACLGRRHPRCRTIPRCCRPRPRFAMPGSPRGATP
jgi:membrane fusion protein (multidrug efflux system)